MFESWLNLNQVTAFIHAHPHGIYFIAFLISFVESLAIIGAIAPGAILMSVLGFLIGVGTLPGKAIYFYLALGALAGDLLSFTFGYYFRARIERMWPFTRWPKILTNGKEFFKNHGGKSICIGRFIGPMRAVIPLIAGALKMSFFRFLLFTLPSAIAWSVIYTIPGWLLGAIALELPPKLMMKFIIYGILFLGVAWSFAWLVQFNFKWLRRKIENTFEKYGARLVKESKWSKKWLESYSSPGRGLSLLLRLLVFLILYILLIVVIFTESGFLSQVNQILCSLFSSFRMGWLDKLAIIFTTLGNLSFLLGFSALVLLGLWLGGYKRESKFWFVTVAICGIVTALFKYLYFIPRPAMVAYELKTSSFPSAHVTLSTVFYGFLGVIYFHLIDKKNKLALFLAVTVVVIVSLSRLYLGAHWLTDVFGGLLLAGIILSSVLIFYEKSPLTFFDRKYLKKWSLVLLAVLLVWWIFNIVVHYSYQKQQYKLVWPKQILSFSYLINQDDPFILKEQIQNSMPSYRTNRLGFQVEPFNLLYIGKVETVKKWLEERGWKVQSHKASIKQLIEHCVHPILSRHFSPLLPLYHGKKPVLILTKLIPNSEGLFILKLWDADIDFFDLDGVAYLGSVEYHLPLPDLFSWARLKQSNKLREINFRENGQMLVDDLATCFQVIRLSTVKNQNREKLLLDYLWVIKE